MEHLNTEGLVTSGEFDTRVMRSARTEVDHYNALVAGQVIAYTDVQRWVQAQVEAAGPYDDTRALEYLLVRLGDRIREVQSPATEDPNA